MQKKRSSTMTVLCIGLLLVLLVGAFYVPEVLNKIYDMHTLEQVNTRALNFELYEPKYASFEEKVHAIAMAVKSGEELQLIELAQENEEQCTSIWQNLSFSEEDLNREIELFLRDGLHIEMDLERIALNDCRLYTVLGTGERSDTVLAGIQVYGLCYVPTEYMDKGLAGHEYEYFECLRLYVDAEFHKIYAFSMADRGAWGDFTSCVEAAAEVDAMAEYWGIDCSIVETLCEEVGETGVPWGKQSGYRLFLREDDSYIYVWKDGAAGKRANVICMGMLPFFNALSASDMQSGGGLISVKIAEYSDSEQ